jgi:hypothetical protein
MPRRLKSFAKWLLPPLTAAQVLIGGININNLSPNEVMAQPAQRRDASVEKEDVEALRGLAQQAAHAFRDYILTGDEKYRTTFQKIYQGTERRYQYKGKQLTEYHEFMQEWFKQIETVLESSQVKPYLEAYKKDLDHVLGIRMEPMVAGDFLTAVHSIRTQVRTNSVGFDKIDKLIKADKETKGNAPAGSALERMREYRQQHPKATAEEAARHALEDKGVQAIRDRYGSNLTDHILSQRPEIQAERCVQALRDFMVTGDTSRRDEFRAIFDSNTSQAFWNAFGREFRSKISRGDNQAIAGIARAYNAKHNGLEPNEFATAISAIYTAATNGNVREMERLRQKHGTEVVDPFVNIVAIGMAGRAAELFAQTLVTGNTETMEEFLEVYNSQFVALENGSYVQVRLEDNDTFFREFSQLYRDQISTNRRISSIVTNFRRNVLPIAIRDIYAELARENPDMYRLTASYGTELVEAVSGNAANIQWMVRSADELNSVLSSRAKAGDQNAKRLRTMKMPGKKTNRGAALAAVYTTLATERMRMRSIDGAAYVAENFDELSWLSGTPAQIEAELSSRATASPPDAHAVALNSKFPTNAGQTLSTAYGEVSRMRTARQQLVSRYGADFVDYVSKNLGHLHWAVRPVGQLEEQMRSRTSDPFVMQLQTNVDSGRYVVGYTIGTLASALQDVYRQLGSGNDAQLVQRYGQPLVDYVSGNRAKLGWLSGKTDDVEKRLQEGNDPVTVEARAMLYPYGPVQLIKSYVQGRQGVRRRGLARMDARDSLGGLFLEPVAAREATTQVVQPREIRDRARAVVLRAGTFERDLEDVGGQLDQPIMKPAKVILEAHVSRWERENNRIRDDATASIDADEIERLEEDQVTLRDTMLNGQELRSSVELAFSMVHLAETGGDIGTSAFAQAGTTGVTASDIGTLSRLLTWYRGLNPEKQRVVGDIVAAVLGKADPELYEFIASMRNRGYFEAVTRVYGSLSGRGASDTAALRQRYGDEFVDLILAHQPVLTMLESPSVRPSDLERGENQLFANIVIRVYRAVTNPDEKENRARMVELYGESFVRAVEAQRAHCAPLADQAAGLDEVRALPDDVKEALMKAYPSAHSRVAKALGRAYRGQDASLFRDMSDVYGVVRNAPGKGASDREKTEFTTRIAELEQTYGRTFVRTVYENRGRLRFLESPSASVEQMQGLDGALLERLHTSYEGSHAATRANFMESFQHVADRLPGLYRRIAGVLIYDNATATLGDNLSRAIELYRTEFGNNDYLFRQFINFDLLNSSIGQLLDHYGIDAPPGLSDGFQTPEEMAAFLGSEPGKQLITAGREFYRTLETEYLQGRREMGIGDDQEDSMGLTAAGVRQLRSQLSIIDALYLGYALRDVSSAGSAFGPSAGRATMNAILTITQRDPYLVGPFVMQVLPAIIQVAQDERTLVAAIESFNALFAQRYAQGARDLAYSNYINRRYFLEVFARIGQRLPQVTTTFDHNRMEDELRMMSERQLMQAPYHPFGYRYRPHFLQLEGMEPLPMLYGQEGAPIRLREEPIMPASPFDPVPGGYAFDSSARGTFSVMYDSIYAPAPRMLQLGVGPRYRIGPLGASTIIRELTRLFGPMPVNYSDYWLSADAEMGGYYAYGGSVPTRRYTETGEELPEGAEEGPARTERQGYSASAAGRGRTVTGGVAGIGNVRGTTEETAGGGAETVSRERQGVDIQATESGLPYPMAGIIPLALSSQEGRGLMSGRQEFNYEHAATTTGGEEVETVKKTGGLLETYSRIARERGTDMLVVVAGEHAPELRQPDADDGTEGPIVQEERSRIQSRVYIIDGQTGNAYQVAYGLDTHARILNYLYGAADTQHVLSSLRFAGREMAPAPSLSEAETRRRDESGRGEGEPWEGFDGAAVGFTIPRSGGDNYSFLALQQLVRSMGDGVAVHEEQAAGNAITNLLDSGKARDAYAAFYRGAQTVDSSLENPRQVENPEWAHGSGEIMWRRMAIAPRQASFELRAVGGYPTTAGARWRYERQTGAHTMYGHGLTAGYTEVDLLREFRAVDREADEIYSRMTNVLVSMYGWGENEARGTGWLVSGSYLYGTLEDYIESSGAEVPDTEDTSAAASTPEQPSPHYASLLTMYWAKRYKILAGAQRVPGFGRMYDRIDDAMRAIQTNPTSEEQVLEGLADGLRHDFTRDIWRFSLGYGWDGEKVRVYTVASGQWTGDETAYGNLYGLFLFGRPTRAFLEVLGHAYTQSPLVVYEDSTQPGGFAANYRQTQPYLDAYAGFGVIDWPSIQGARYEREVTIAPDTDHAAALRHHYAIMGSDNYDTKRAERLFGKGFTAAVENNRESLDWMVRPVSEIRSELAQREKDDDPTVKTMLGYRESDLADAVRDIYIELRRAAPDIERLNKEYGDQLVSIVAQRVHDLDWVLLEPSQMSRQFRRKAGKSGSPEAKMAAATIPEPPVQGNLTGEEVRRLFEQNITEVLYATADAETRHGLRAEMYDVRLASHLTSKEGKKGRSDKYYVLITPVSDRPNSRGSILIGNEDDYDEWREHGWTIGRGVSRVEIGREGNSYKFTFSGDRRRTWLQAGRVMGGITLPLTEQGFETYKPDQNWTLGGILHLMQDHKQDLLGGALYGVRTFGNEQWQNWQITFSHRLQTLNTGTMSDELFTYVFFNRATRQVVFASGDVFEDSDEMASVCSTLSEGQCSDLDELQRTTGGVGLTWARADVVTGSQLAVHFFFEGGVESRRSMDDIPAPEEGATSFVVSGSYLNNFVFRGGVGVDYTRQAPGSPLGTKYQLFLTGARGHWPSMSGNVTRPEMLRPWASEITGMDQLGWWLMLYGRVQW